MKRIIWLALLLVCMSHFAEAQGWRRTYTFLGDRAFYSQSTILIKNDSFVTAGLLLTGGSLITTVAVQKCDPNGNPVWQKTFPAITSSILDSLNIIPANDGGYTIAISNIRSGGITALKINEQGNIVWQKNYLNYSFSTRYQIIANKTQTGYAILSSETNLRINNTGDSLYSTQSYFKNPPSWAINSNVGKDFLGIVYSNNQTRLAQINTDTIFSYTVGLWADSLGSKTLKLEDNNYLILGYDITLPLIRNYQKISPNGQIIWNKRIRLPYAYSEQFAFTKTNDGGFIESFTQTDNGENRITRFDKNGDIIWEKVLSLPIYSFSHSIYQTSDGGFLIGLKQYHVKVNANGDIFSSNISGHVREDQSNDCIAQANEPPFKGLMTVTATKNGTNDTYYSAIDTLGNYRINLDTGNYTVKLNGVWSQLWQNCTPSVSRSIPLPYSTDSADFALKPLVNCPAMRVNAGTWGLRRCVENTYSVNYFNDGTTVARNAFVEITIDSLMEFRRASRPLSSRVGQRLRFDVGDVDYGRGGSFNVTVYVKCGDSTRLNQTLCFETHVFPDTICTPTTGWNGANIVVTGTCARDSVEFTIRNTGNAATGTVRSLIVEDQVMFAVQPISLPPNGVLIKKQPANGSTWRLSVQQVANNPRSTFATAFVEGCRNNPTAPFSTGNATAFPDADGDAAVDIQCLAIRGAYDPNDKTGYPLGTGTSRQIGQNQDIEYLIRFQNTGTDTAFQVVLRDTLPSQLDLTSIEPGASSHPYTWDLTGKGILIFNFDNIRLMDSFRNEPASHGFVKFRIKQKKDLPIGTKIENSAGIYFDFNAPVITNRTLHTIGKDVLLTATVEQIFDEKVKIEVFPNPFSDFLTFNIKQATPSVNEGIFELFDLTGKVLRREKFVDNQFTFERKDLPMGIFIFKISTVDGRLIGQGKVVAK